MLPMSAEASVWKETCYPSLHVVNGPFLSPRCCEQTFPNSRSCWLLSLSLGLVHLCTLPCSLRKDSTPSPLPLCVLPCSLGKDSTPNPLLLVLYSCVVPCSVGKDLTPGPHPSWSWALVYFPAVLGRIRPPVPFPFFGLVHLCTALLRL